MIDWSIVIKIFGKKQEMKKIGFMNFVLFYRKLTIGYYLSDGKFSPHPGCTRAVKEAVVTLRNMGHTVVEVRLRPWFSGSFTLP